MILCFAALAITCNPTRKAERLTDKAIRLDKKAVVAKIAPEINTVVRIIKDTQRLQEFTRIKEEIIRRIDSAKIDTVLVDCTSVKQKLAEANEFIDGLQSLLDDLPVVTDTIIRADTGRIWLAEYNLGIAQRDILAEKTKRIRDLQLAIFSLILLALIFAYFLFRKR